MINLTNLFTPTPSPYHPQHNLTLHISSVQHLSVKVHSVACYSPIIIDKLNKKILIQSIKFADPRTVVNELN